MNVPALIRNCFIGFLVWVAIVFGAVSVSNAATFGQPFTVRIYCDTAGNMAKLLLKKEPMEEDHCFTGARVSARFVKYHGTVKAFDDNEYSVISLVPINDFKWKVVFSFLRVQGEIS